MFKKLVVSTTGVALLLLALPMTSVASSSYQIPPMPPGASLGADIAPSLASLDAERLVATPDAVVGSSVTIDGAGWGHGIGMSQYGSFARALAGQSYVDILAEYYEGTSIERVGEGTIPALPAVMTNVLSDDTHLVVSIILGPGSGEGLVNVTRGETETVGLAVGDSFAVIDGAPNADGGCTVTFDAAVGVTDWPLGSCDIDVALAPSDSLPASIVALDSCRTENCTFGWGEALHIVDNMSALRTVPDAGWPGFDVVVETTLDDYTRGIKESIFSWGDTPEGMHALYTQAVAARSYAASFLPDTINPAAPDHTSNGCFCHLKNDSSFQVYAGWLSGFAKWTRWDTAAIATAGEIVHDAASPNGIARTFYTSSNGGASENVEDIWTSADPITYLRYVPDHFSVSPESENPYASWSVTMAASDFASALGFSSVTDVTIIETYESGTPSRIDVTGLKAGQTKTELFTGVDFDETFGLRSAHITAINNEGAPPTSYSGWQTQLAADLNGDGRMDIAEYHPDDGQWWAEISNGAGFDLTAGGYGASIGPDDEFLAGDVTGDGEDDVVVVSPAGGLTVYAGPGLNSSGTWGNGVTGADVSLIGDFTGDGKDDIAQFDAADGTWTVGVSSGSGFSLSVWTDFYTATGWEARLVGDFDNDGDDDIAQFHPWAGKWWVSRSNGSSGFSTSVWADFTTASGWEARSIGDFNNDGRDDIAQFHPGNGTWWVSLSTGGEFSTRLWADFYTSSGWEARSVGDFDGDGRDDIAQFHPGNGTWWVSLSKVSYFSTRLWADFYTATGWVSRSAGDFTGSGKADIAQFHPGNGTWWVSKSTGVAFTTSEW